MSNPDQVTVVAHLKARPGKEDDLRQALTALVSAVRTEPGCVNYDLHEAPDEPGHFVFHENWESPEALQTHMTSPAMKQALGPAAAELLAGAPTIVHLRRIA